MARVLAALFACGAALVLLSLALPRDEDADVLTLVSVSAIALVVAGVLVAARTGVSIRALQALLAGGSLLATGCVVAGGHGGAAYALLLAWVPAYAAFFFTLRAALAEVALAVVLLGAGLLVATEPVDDRETVWLLAAGTLAVVGGLVSRMAAAVRQQAADRASLSRLGGEASGGGDYAQAACDGLALTLRADVAIYLAPLPQGGGLEVVAMTGTPEAGLVFSGDRARGALQAAFRSAEPAELEADEPGAGLRRWDGRKLGLAQPVVREGEVVAVLAVAWTAPRRALPGRTASVALLHAAEASLAVDRARRLAQDRERRALEINDNIVQGLVVAKYTAQRGDVDAAVEAIDETLDRARRLISDQLSQVSGRGADAIRPGDLAREAAAGVSQPPSPPPRGPSPG